MAKMAELWIAARKAASITALTWYLGIAWIPFFKSVLKTL